MAQPHLPIETDLSADQEASLSDEQQKSAVYWCQECNKEVIPEAEVGARDSEREDTICPYCSSRFVEIMTTAPDFQRHREPSMLSSGDRHGGEGEQDEESDNSHERQVLHLLRFLARYTRNIPRRSIEERQNSTGQRSNQAISDIQDQDSLEHDLSFSLSMRQETPELQLERELQEGELSSRSETQDSVLVEEEPVEATEFRDGSSFQEEDEADEGDQGNDSEADASFLEVGDWDSMDEDDEGWEEVEGDEDHGLEGMVEEMDDLPLEENEDGSSVGGRSEVRELLTHEQGVGGDDQQFRGDTGRNGARRRNWHNTIHRYFEEILGNFESRNLEIRLEFADTYIGNPGDYLDARGYEQFLQQLFDSDNSCRGAPPAAKTAIEALFSTIIEQKHLDDDSALCAICKDTICIGEHAKQMPCLHLYHSDCIIPWLSSRNSCPVCRYELPTDDIDYEEKKRNCSFASTSSQEDIGFDSGISSHEEDNN